MGYWKIVEPQTGTNLITNPSFETSLTGWSSTDAGLGPTANDFLFGTRGLDCQLNSGDQNCASYAASGLSVLTTYVFSAYVKIQEGTGVDLTVQASFSGFSGAVLVEQGATASQDGIWTRIWVKFQTGTPDVTGNLDIELTEAYDGSGLPIISIYVDGAQLEEANRLTTYFDGDQPDCKWTGTEHASTSERLGGLGGAIYDFKDDFSMHNQRFSGSGAVPIRHIVTRRSIIPGAEYQRALVEPASIVLEMLLVTTSQDEYHRVRNLFLDKVNPALRHDGFWLLYEGPSSVPKFLAVRYVGGMEGSYSGGFTERLTLGFTAFDNPIWQSINFNNQDVDFNDQVSWYEHIGRTDGEWNGMGRTASSTSGAPSGFCKGFEDGEIFIFGNFVDLDGNANHDYLVQYDIPAQSYSIPWTAGDVTGQVNDAIIGPDGKLYMVGNFTNVGGVAANDYLVTWDGSSWGTVGAPSVAAGVPTCLHFDRAGNLYVGGTFTDWAGIANADRIAMWDGSSWSALGTGMNGDVNDIVSGFDGTVYACGEFTTAGGTSCGRVAAWDGTAWVNIGDLAHATLTVEGNQLAVDDSGDIYLGGLFETIDGVTLNNIAKFNGSQWLPLGSGATDDTFGVASGEIYSIEFDSEGRLWLSGDFVELGGELLVSNVGIWESGTYTYPLADVPIPSGSISAVGEDIFISLGGTFSSSSVSGKTLITNDGNLNAYPVITFKFTGSPTTGVIGDRLLGLWNYTTGARIWLNYKLTQNEEVTIDLRRGKQSLTSSFFGKRNEFLPVAQLADFYLQPGQNVIFAFYNQSTANEGIIKFHDSYMGVD